MGKAKTRTPVKVKSSPPPRGVGLPSILIPLVLLLLVGLVWTSALLILDKDNEKESAPSPKVETPTETFNYPANTGRPEGTSDENRKALANQALELLAEARKLGGDDDVNGIVNAVAAGDESVLPKAFVEKFRFVDKVQDEKEIRAAGLISLIQLGQVIERSVPSGRELELLSDNAWQFVYVDMEAGNAFVPLSLYLGPESAFSFEYVWVDGEWVFSPYSLIDAISAADVAARGAQAGPLGTGE